uniref:Hypothetical_protein n=1 Tax=Leishmania donovani TaxID=5661 RepID=A0A6J8FN56_LEIDO|nr:hypothetical_protein [Leishmania donovani]
MGILVHGCASRGLAFLRGPRRITPAADGTSGAPKTGEKAGALRTVGILTADGSIIHAAERGGTGARGVHLSPRRPRSQHAPASGRRSGCGRGPLRNAHPVQNVIADPYYRGRRMMQTVVSTIYGVAFSGRNMTPAENRNTALALERAFDCFLTPARLSRGR